MIPLAAGGCSGAVPAHEAGAAGTGGQGAGGSGAGTRGQGGGGAGTGGQGAGGADPRQSLRDESLFENLDFEQVDATGAPVGWACLDANEQQAACRTDTAHAEHGKRALVLPSGWTAYQTTKVFDPAKGLRFDYYSEGGPIMPADTGVYAYDASFALVSSLFVDGLSVAPHGRVDVPSRGAMPTAGASSLYLMLRNSTGSEDLTPQGTLGPDGPDLYIDDIIAVQDQANPPPKVGSLLRGTHVDTFSLAASSTPAAMYVSLPIDWASQTPLYFELTVTPPSIVDHITYATEAENNWGATITFAAGAEAPSVVVRWDAVVLDEVVADSDLPTVYAALSPPSQWLSPSGIIESADPGIAGTASGLVSPGASTLDTMLGVIGWTSSNIQYGVAASLGLDATTVYDAREGTCTGFANLAAAMGRSLGVPTRHVTNMFVGESQDMHSIDEFYLGPQGGWRRVEPQGTAARVPDDYGLIMRLVLPGDESPMAGRNSPAGELMLGIPEHEFSEAQGAPAAFTEAGLVNVFTDCNFCGNHADPQADLRDSTPAAMAALFKAARAHWQTTLAEYAAAGGLPAAEMAVRRQALNAGTLADVQALVKALP